MSVRSILRPGQLVPMNPEYFRPGTKFPVHRIHIMYNQAGLGDNIARVPAVRYLLDKNWHLLVHLWVPEYFLPLARIWFADHLVDGGRLTLHSMLDWRPNNEYSGERHYDFSNNQHSDIATPAGRVAFNLLVNEDVPDSALTYPILTGDDLPAVDLGFYDYCVILPGYTSITRRMSPEFIAKVHAEARFLGLQVVYLGANKMLSGDPALYGIKVGMDTIPSDGHSLIDRTDLIQAAAVMQGARFVFGLDTGLVHLAACTGANIICGYTSVAPRTRRIVRTHCEPWKFTVVESQSECRYCQSHMGAVYGHKFNTCFYGDLRCADAFDIEAIKRAMCKYL